jgi:hypothetical protein
MAYSALADKADFSSIGILPDGLPEQRIDIFIRKAQELDLRPRVGAAFYTKIMTEYQATTAEYVELVEGGTYVDANGDTIDYQGLQKALMAWAYARFIGDQQANVTSHGLVRKLSPHSEPLPAADIAHMQQRFESEALNYWKQTEDYLNENAADFPLWTCTNKRATGAIRLNAIGKKYTTTTKNCQAGDDDYVDSGYVD